MWTSGVGNYLEVVCILVGKFVEFHESELFTSFDLHDGFFIGEFADLKGVYMESGHTRSKNIACNGLFSANLLRKSHRIRKRTLTPLTTFSHTQTLTTHPSAGSSRSSGNSPFSRFGRGYTGRRRSTNSSCPRRPWRRTKWHSAAEHNAIRRPFFTTCNFSENMRATWASGRNQSVSLLLGLRQRKELC